MLLKLRKVPMIGLEAVSKLWYECCLSIGLAKLSSEPVNLYLLLTHLGQVLVQAVSFALDLLLSNNFLEI